MTATDYLNDRAAQQELVADFRELVRHIAHTNPNLTATGWDDPALRESTFHWERIKVYSDDFLLEVAVAYAFICAKGLNETMHSDTYTDRAERFGADHEMGNYVTNGAFIVAAIMHNYECKQNKNSPSCTFRPPAVIGMRRPYSLKTVVAVSIILKQSAGDQL
jgi:hypothetical protein